MFQSTRPQGARLSSVNFTLSMLRFQSTRPQGARPRIPAAPLANGQFQSTRPQGARRLNPNCIKGKEKAWGFR